MSLTDKNNYIPNGWTRLPNGKLVKGDASEDKMVTSYKKILNKSDASPFTNLPFGNLVHPLGI